MGINIENVLWTSVGAKAVQLIFFIAVAATLAADPDFVTYFISVLLGVPMLFLGYPLFRMLQKETPKRRANLTIAFALEIVIAAGSMIEVWLISWSDFLITSPTGKIIAMIFSVLFLIYWIIAYKYAHEYFVENLPDHKRSSFVSKSKDYSPIAVNASNASATRNYANLGVQRAPSDQFGGSLATQDNSRFDTDVRNLIASTGKSKLQVEKALKACNNDANIAFENLLVENDIDVIHEDKEEDKRDSIIDPIVQKKQPVAKQKVDLAGLQRDKRLMMLDAKKK